MEIKDLILLMWRNARYLILSVVVGALLGILVAEIQSPVYEATTKLLVSRSRQQGGSDSLTLSDEQLLAINLQLVKSQSVLDAASIQTGVKIDPDAIQVAALPNTLIIQIKVQDTNSKQAAAIANALVVTLIQTNETLLTGRYSSFEEALTSQIGDVEAQIADLQTQISQQNEASVQQQLAQVNQQIDQLKTDGAALENEIASFPLSLTPVQSATLAEKQAQLDQLHSQLALYQQIQANLTYVGKPGQNGLGRDNPQVAGLQSTLDLYQQMHQNLLTSLGAVRIARMQSDQAINQIVSAIPPKKPVRPMPSLYVLLGSMVGLAMAATIILMLDHFDDTLRTSAQVEDLLELHVLGAVQDEHQAGGLSVALDPFSAQADAFRALGASLEMVGRGRDICTLLVLNAGPKELKTSIAANLAAIHAQQGRQVILVDGDLKHPHLHTLLGIENSKGLADLLDDRCDLTDACHGLDGFTGLSVIPSGTVDRNATAWMDADKWGQVLDELRQRADLVIVDSPSADGADAQILAGKMNAVLMVIHCGHTRLETAKTTLRRFQLINVFVAGAIFYQMAKVQPLIFSYIRKKTSRV